MKNITIILLAFLIQSCAKKLDLKPDSALVIPKTVLEFESLLDNEDIINITPALAQLSADEYYIPTRANFNSLFTEITKTAYTWESNIFKGQQQILDWNAPYTQIFYSNSVLDLLAQKRLNENTSYKPILGWAYFIRAYAYYNLMSTYAKAYNASTATIDLGVPLKLTGAITTIVPRSNVEDCYNQIIKDLTSAISLLPQSIISNKRNRPSRVAVYALLARVYLSMRKYKEAENFASAALQRQDKLIDYNTLTISNSSSFLNDNVETIYYSRQGNSAYSQTTYSTGALYGVDTNIIKKYMPDDLRKAVYFSLNINGNYAASKGINTTLNYPFTGLATDEMYMIKAECLARRNQIDSSMVWLNNLLINRFKRGQFVSVNAFDKDEALSKILEQRKLGLIWRSLRWTDLKRLNLEGANIILTRNIDKDTYTLLPNSARYVLPIPDDEVNMSDLIQNQR